MKVNKKYQIIYADPPWRFSSRQLQRYNKERFSSLECEYRTMSIEEIKALDIKSITSDDASLFLWTPDAHVKVAIEVIEAWGFNYTTVAFIWEKITKYGKLVATLGSWTMKNCELCLLGTKGYMLKYKQSNNVYQLIKAERQRHSTKPQEARKRIVRLFGDIPRIELFARGDRVKDLLGYNQFDGWDVWGNEVESNIEL